MQGTTAAFFAGRSVVRWGIIGCGDVCEVKSGPGFQKAAGSSLVAAMRRDGDKARDFAERHGVPRWYADAEQLIHDPEIDAVYIATPPGSHRDYALATAVAGKPCYVEKPMARNQAECQEMIAAFEAARLPLYVAYYRRFLPRFLAVRDLLDAGALGPLRAINYDLANDTYLRADPANPPWRMQPEHSGGGMLLDLGSHLIDLLDFLFGPLREVAGESRNVSGRLRVADQTDLAFTTEDGVPGRCHWNFASTAPVDRLEIVGELGRIALSCFGNEPLVLETPTRIEHIDRPNPQHMHQPLIQAMVNDLLGIEHNCHSTGITAARASLIMDRIGGSE